VPGELLPVAHHPQAEVAEMEKETREKGKRRVRRRVKNGMHHHHRSSFTLVHNIYTDI
jgi:hypothetical protein